MSFHAHSINIVQRKLFHAVCWYDSVLANESTSSFGTTTTAEYEDDEEEDRDGISYQDDMEVDEEINDEFVDEMVIFMLNNEIRRLHCISILPNQASYSVCI